MLNFDFNLKENFKPAPKYTYAILTFVDSYVSSKCCAFTQNTYFLFLYTYIYKVPESGLSVIFLLKLNIHQNI